MAGRRIVDAAKLFNASKSVAQKHIALRSNQLDAYSKTSTLAKAVKNQTDRVTLTAAAAIALSKRFSEDGPAYARAAAEQATGRPIQHATKSHAEHIPREETVTSHQHNETPQEGLQQDHHYDRSERNTTDNPPPKGELEVEQEEAPRRPLPDGTIPTAGVTLEREEKGKDTFSERPANEAPKAPLADEHADPPREETDGIQPVESDESTIPLPGKPRGGMETQIGSIPSHANEPQPASTSPQIQKLQEGHDRDVFYARSVESKSPSPAQTRSQIPAHTETKQASNEHVDDIQLNQDVYYSTPAPREEVKTPTTENEKLPEGVNTDIFHSTRVAQMLGSDPYSRKEAIRKRPQIPSRNPFIPPQYQAGHGHDAPKTESKSQIEPVKKTGSDTQPATTQNEMQDLAASIARDAQSSSAPSEVCLSNTTYGTC